MPDVNDVVLPGDTLSDLKVSEKSGKTVLGPGLQAHADSVSIVKPGILRFKDPNFYWIDSHQKRYIPVRGENVLGIVTQKSGDVFKVDIGSSEQASLSFLAFEGATKKNRPTVKVGDVLYATLLVASKDTEPELVCIDGTGRSSGLGVITEGGFLLHCSINLVRKILSSECTLFKALAKHLPFEVAVGMNGRVWVKGRSQTETAAIVNTIASAEFMNEKQIKLAVRQARDAIAAV